ncbi:MerR family transcriptional regulator [Kitasatospora kazusensis]|uniref:MerR family transcriptional regulator n=1 Tax=Kitasatospora kazusensis TaxID=407974 RepID=A0ABN3AAK5_9ACTN
MDRTKLLPIGQFAQATGLTITALRHYDASAVLAPDRTDPVSGYRYYRRDQVETGQLVSGLRQLGLPIDQIREVLEHRSAGRDFAVELWAHIEAAQQRVDKQRMVLRQLLTRSTEGDLMSHRVTVRRARPVHALTYRAEIDSAGFDQFVRTAFQSLYTVAGAAPLAFNAPAFLRYHGRLTDEGTTLVEACLPFRADAAQPGDLPEPMYVLDVAETMFAGVVLQGAESGYPQILAAYDAVADWIAAHGFDFAGPAYETYQQWCGEQGHADNTLEIGWPIDGA